MLKHIGTYNIGNTHIEIYVKPCVTMCLYGKKSDNQNVNLSFTTSPLMLLLIQRGLP